MPRKPSPSRKPGRSGAIGGPATAGGINYQAAYATLRALQAIPRVFASPHLTFAVRLEPRVGAAPGTTWDLAFDPENSLFEAKIHPTKDDVFDWVRRSGLAIQEGATARRFCLLSGSNEGKHLRQVKGLVRVYRECGGDPQRFEQLRSCESEDYSAVLAELGTDPLRVLSRLDIKVESLESLREQIETIALALAGPDAPRLRTHLLTKITEGLENRLTINLRDEIEAYERSHRALPVIQFTEPEALDENAAAALFLLQCCPRPLPRIVLADVMAVTQIELGGVLKTLVDTGIVTCTSTHISVGPLPRRTISNLGETRRGPLLRRLTRYVRGLEVLDPQVRDQIVNVCHLMTRTALDCKEAVAVAFMDIDKHLKQLGDKHTVLELARVAIAATRAIPGRSEEVARAEAHALICGESWVFQRVGKLEEARAFATESFERGQAIGWTLNDAFCEKCIGRICRMLAEASDDPAVKKRLFDESAYRLQRAIELFSTETAFGPQSVEVGECHSLLGRTLLMMGEFVSANERVSTAERLISDEDSKVGMDLTILKGELAATAGNPTEAERLYDTVLRGESPDLVKTEMRARAFLQRARTRAVLGKRREAEADYAAAEGVWRSLKEQRAAAIPTVERVLLRTKLSPEDAARFKAVRPEVAAIASVRHEAKLSQLQSGSSRRARDVGSAYWDQLFAEARRQWALDDIEW